MIALLAVVLGTVLLAGCLPPPAGTPATIVTDPPLFPAFKTGITNYVVRCNPNSPVAVHVTSPTSTLVSVNGGYPRGGIYGVNVNQQPGQRFTIAITTDPAHDVTTRYNVRCLPTDFPQWSATPAPYGLTPFFMTAPLFPSTPTYEAIYDRNGVPLWWGEPQVMINSTVLPDGNVGTMTPEGVDERKLDGTFVRSVKTVGGRADGHDVLLLPNGHFVLVTIQARSGVDLTAVGGPADTSICDHVVQEIDPTNGSVVWSWDTFDHIPVTEMDPQWWPGAITGGPTSFCGYDVYHWNAIDPTGTGFILSYRHLDAVYDIDQASGNILWKLGGTPRPERLTIVGDPVFAGGSHFGGQHDSRLLPDGTVTFFDDGSGLPRLGRAVRYSINTTAHTATLLNSVSDPGVSQSYCCGSARYLGSGVWVIGWGGSTDGVGKGTESVNGIRQYSISFPGALVYRVIPLTSSQVTTQQLVAAMDTRFANPSIADEHPPPEGAMPFPP